MTGIDTLLPLLVAFALPFAVAFGVARRGQARKAWALPAGIAALGAAFGLLGLRLDAEGTGIGEGIVRSMAILALPGVLGGVAGILLGRRGA